MLERLAADPDHWVRAQTAANTAAPAWLLERLAADPDPKVRRCVAENPATPPVVVEHLCGDAAREVRSQAEESVDQTRRRLLQPTPRRRQGL